MTGKTHLLFGAATATVTSLAFYNPESAYFAAPTVFILTAALGSLVPDLDTPESTISRKLPILSQLICLFCKHRTLTHDAVIWGVLGALISMKYPVMLGFFFGYWGHLLLDSMTVQGIPWLYFLHKKAIYRTLPNGVIHFFPTFLRFQSGSIPATVCTILTFILFTFVVNMLSGNSFPAIF